MLTLSLANNVSAQQSMNTDTFNWDTTNDFAAGYFDVFYDNDLFYAIPSIFTNNLENILVKNFSDLNNCQRKRPSELRNLIYAKERDVKKSSRLKSPLYKNKAAIGNLNEVSIDGISGWRFPTLNEMKKSTAASDWQKKLCWDSHIGKKYPRSDFPRYYGGPSIITFTKGGTRNGSWAVINSALQVYGGRKNKGWENGTNTSNTATVILVREPTEIEKKAFDNPRLSPVEIIKKYAKLIIERELTATKNLVKKPVLQKHLKRPDVVKDEFETSSTYEQRRLSLIRKWEDKNNAIELHNKDLMRQYDISLDIADQDYKAQEELFSKNNYREVVYKKAVEVAIRKVLGKPYFKNLKYDADSQLMRATVFSARYPQFYRQASFFVPIKKARSFKDDLILGKIIPLVVLDNDYNIASVEAVTNKDKIALDFVLSKNKNTVVSFNEFIAKYPSSSQAKVASKKIAQLKEQARKAELERKKRIEKEEKRRKAEKQAEREAYLAKKHVGDSVCKPGRVAFGLIGITISAFVERVDSNRVQLRISSTEGQSIHYNGTLLRNGNLIWDSYDEWKRCN